MLLFSYTLLENLFYHEGHEVHEEIYKNKK